MDKTIHFSPCCGEGMFLCIMQTYCHGKKTSIWCSEERELKEPELFVEHTGKKF